VYSIWIRTSDIVVIPSATSLHSSNRLSTSWYPLSRGCRRLGPIRLLGVRASPHCRYIRPNTMAVTRPRCGRRPHIAVNPCVSYVSAEKNSTYNIPGCCRQFCFWPDRRRTTKTAKKSFTHAKGNLWRVKYRVGSFNSWAPPHKTLGRPPAPTPWSTPLVHGIKY